MLCRHHSLDGITALTGVAAKAAATNLHASCQAGLHAHAPAWLQAQLSHDTMQVLKDCHTGHCSSWGCGQQLAHFLPNTRGSSSGVVTRKSSGLSCCRTMYPPPLALREAASVLEPVSVLNASRFWE